MSDCAYYQELISRMLDDEVSGDERDVLARHIVTCPDCQAVYVAFRSLSETLREDPVEPPEELHENIMAEVRREELKKRNAPRVKSASKQKKRARGALALAACAAVAILALTSLPRLFRADSAAPQSAMSMAEPAAAPAPKAAEVPMADAAPAEGMANDALFAASEAAQAEEALDTGEAKRGLLVLSEGEQTRAFRAVLTEEPEAEPEGEPDESFQVAYTDYGEPCTVTVRLYGERAYYARSEGESCRVACSASELLDILG